MKEYNMTEERAENRNVWQMNIGRPQHYYTAEASSWVRKVSNIISSVAYLSLLPDRLGSLSLDVRSLSTSSISSAGITEAS